MKTTASAGIFKASIFTDVSETPVEYQSSYRLQAEYFSKYLLYPHVFFESLNSNDLFTKGKENGLQLSGSVAKHYLGHVQYSDCTVFSYIPMNRLTAHKVMRCKTWVSVTGMHWIGMSYSPSHQSIPELWIMPGQEQRNIAHNKNF